MVVQDNLDIQKQVKKLVNTLEETIEVIRHLDKLADSRYEEVDILDEIENLNTIVFDIRKVLFDSKIEVDRVKKALDKHVAHTLNPIAKTAPKSAKKGRGKVKQESKPYTVEDYYKDNAHNDLERIVRMNEIMPGKDGHHPKKHTTISRGNAPKSNPAHDNDKPF